MPFRAAERGLACAAGRRRAGAARRRLAKARTAYAAYLAERLALLGQKDAPARAQAVMDFETGITRVRRDASLDGRPAPVIDGFTGGQRFYPGYARVWRRNVRAAALRDRLLTDPHAPSPQRAAIVRNPAPWYDAFAPAPDATLYLAPADRVIVW